MSVKPRTHRGGRGHDFTHVLEWSKYKHELLTKYLHVWCYKLGSHNRELAFVDTHAGAGKYDDGKDGSPLIAVKYNDEKSMIGRGTGMTVHAFETDTNVAPLLRANLASYMSRTPPRAIVYEQSFFANPAPVLSATRLIPTLLLIDPFGTMEVTADHLRPLLTAKRASTEVLVRINPTMLARFAGQARREMRDGGLAQQGAFGRLLQRMNIDLEQIAEEAKGECMTQDKYELLDQYLRLYTSRFRFVQVVPVRANYAAAPKYMLVHGTDNEHGAAHLNDIVSKLEDNLFETTYEREDLEIGQGSLFGPPQRPPSYTTAELDTQTLSIVAAESEIPFINVRAHLATHFGPNFREKHHLAAAKRLIKAGGISVADGSTAITASTVLRVKPPR